jgi:S1-C subfamily serine protease/peptidoglycan hydrolase-like protein with peptidoglycan-binding domain
MARVACVQSRVGIGTLDKMRILKLLPHVLPRGVLALVLSLMVQVAAAQETAFVQVEAQPTLDKAMERARAYAASFDNVQGYRTGSGWYAIVLGPMSADEATRSLVSLRGAQQIPADSYVATAANFGAQFWPAGAEAATAPMAEPAEEAASEPAAEPAAPPRDETRDEALAAESQLDQAGRAQLQEALKWYGFYQGALDGAIGKGTRKSMADWQAAHGYDPTGVLTTIQRAELVGGFTRDKAEFGFDTVSDAESGIEVTLPLGLVEFDSYAPPFVQYRAKGDSGLTVRLISEPGDGAALKGLMAVLQTLDVMPAGGEVSEDETSFTLKGQSATIRSLAWASTEKGNVKGYLISWAPALDDRIDRILPVIRSSFRSLGAKALDPGLVPLDDAVRRGLLAGLEPKKPKSSQSGLFVSPDGAVVTTAAAVAGCGRITIERETPAIVAASDAGSGLVLLKPEAPIAPPAHARFAPGLPQKGAQVAAVGWSYGDRLPAPVLNPGLLEELTGLDGQSGKIRLALDILPGDAGGPVMDATGAVIGLVLPGNPSGPALPRGVALAETDAAVTAVMAQAQVVPETAAADLPATPDALQAQGLGMTALVSCWE